MGYLDPERINNRKGEYDSNADLLTCMICQNILWKPVSCKNCENSFCSRCIETWIEKQGNRSQKQCPFDCSYEQKRAPPVLNNLLSKLQIICSYAPRGCRQILSYDQLDAHENSCEYERTPCSICNLLVSNRPTAEKHNIRQCFQKIHKENPDQIQEQFRMLLNIVEESQRRIEELEKRLENK